VNTTDMIKVIIAILLAAIAIGVDLYLRHKARAQGKKSFPDCIKRKDQDND
jgi:hypothetical protein